MKLKITKQEYERQRPIKAKKYRIDELKKLLRMSDYKAIKYAEGFISEEEYLPIKKERQNYRIQINKLETEIAELEAQIM